jgi:hypothetical protein
MLDLEINNSATACQEIRLFTELKPNIDDQTV